MKKWVMICLTLILLFTVPSVKAEFEDVEVDGYLDWSSENFFEDYFAIKAIFTMVKGSYRLKIYIPPSSYHLIGVGGQDSIMYLYDDDDNLIDELDLVAVFGSGISGLHDINLYAYVGEDYTNISYGTIWIMQSYSALPGGYIDYIGTNAYLKFVTNIWSYAFKALHTHSIVSETPIISAKIDVPSDMQSFTWNFAPGYHTFERNNLTATIYFYDSDGATLESVDMEDYCSISLGVCRLTMSTLGALEGVTFSIMFWIPQTYSSLPSSQYLTYLDFNNTMKYNQFTTYRVNFISNGVNVKSEDFEEFITKPTDPANVGKFIFVQWVDRFGRVYDFNQKPSPEIFLESVGFGGLTTNIVNLYAQFQLTESVTVPTTNPVADETTLISILSAFGMDNAIGMVLAWVVICGLVTFGLFLIKAPMIAIAIVNVFITLFFSITGMLPLVVQILIYTGLFAVVLMGLKGGMEYE